MLNRLNAYYSGRKRAARKGMREAPDAMAASAQAERWEAKADAVLKVAENLDITLKEQEEHGTERH